MSLRRAGILALPLLVVACTDVTQVPLPPDLVFARFSSPNIPTPNDLALASLITTSPLVNACNTQFDACAQPPNAQVALLCAFRAAGGFPADQEVPITIPLTAVRWDPAIAPNGAYVQVAAPAADAASLNAGTVTVVRVDGGTPAPLTFGTDFEVSSAASTGCTGAGAAPTCAPATITIRKASVGGSRRWVAGARYVAAIRGGASGVTAGGRPVQADSAIALAIPHRDITKPENQPLGAVPDSTPAGLCGAGTNTDEIALLKGVSDGLWNPVRWVNAPAGTPFPGAWAPVGDPTITPAFTAVDLAFPYEETASVATFGVAPDPGTLVLVDSGSGVAPLPIDLLRTDADGTVVNNPAFGPAAAGLDTLDGFSTTAMILAQTSGPIDASTVHGGNVFLYRLTKDQTGAVTAVTALRELKALVGGGGNPLTAEYVAQPTPIIVPQGAACPIAGGCSSAIGLQPAVNAGNGIYLPPLAEDTSYAVVITNRVTSVGGAGLVRPSVAKILLDFTVPLTAGGASAIPGVSTATATALETMRAELAPVFAALPAGTTKADVALAYTFKTQSVTGTSLQLAAAPYSVEAGAAQAIFTPSAAPVAVTPPLGVPTAGVNGFWDVTFSSLDAIDKTTGALRPTLATDLANPLPLLAPLHALVAVPEAASVPLCPAPFPAGSRCAKLVVFGHGLGGSRNTMFAVASSLASQGFVAAAIDFPMHGGRAWCGANSDCADGAGDGVCTAFPGAAGQGDAQPPGVCTTGTPKAATSGKYFVTANFFRIRDAFRQNLIDQSALVLALSRPPGLPVPAGNPFAAVLPAGVIVDPSAVYYEGLSLGSMSGTSVVATNPRIARASLSVGGGTLVDVFTSAPAFTAQVDALFLGLGIDRSQLATNPAVAAAYLRTLNVAKWILDPGEPVNYASHLSLDPLPNLLANPDGSVLKAPASVFAQVAVGDTVVPNAFNLLLDNLSGAAITTYTNDNPASTTSVHGMLGTVGQVQLDAALFLVDPAANTPPATRTVTVP